MGLMPYSLVKAQREEVQFLKWLHAVEHALPRVLP